MIPSLQILSIAGGLTYLFMGGDLLVRGSMAIARKLRVPSAIVGATIVALGTSLPELLVSVLAVNRDAGGIAMGNVVGSNIANILLVLGIPAIIAPIAANDRSMRAHAVFMLITSVAFVGLCFFAPLSVWHSLVLLGILVAAILLSVTGRLSLIDLSAKEEKIERTLGLPERPAFAALFVLFGAAALPLGADLTLKGVTELAAQVGLSETAIAASVVALGTSLPELSVSILAAMHRQLGMAIGNVVGSNSLNVLFVIGLTGMFAPIPVADRFLTFDLWVMLGFAIFLTALVLRGGTLGRKLGITFVLAYVAYVWLIF